MELNEFKKEYVQQELGITTDFVNLLRYLKGKGKKVILIKGGNITHDLRGVSNLVINAQNIKKHIAIIKQKPGIEPGLADRKPVSTGRTIKDDRGDNIEVSNNQVK